MGFSEFFTCLYESRLICIVIDGHVNVLSRTTERLTGAQFTCIGKKTCIHVCIACLFITQCQFLNLLKLLYWFFFHFPCFPHFKQVIPYNKRERWKDLPNLSGYFRTIQAFFNNTNHPRRTALHSFGYTQSVHKQKLSRNYPALCICARSDEVSQQTIAKTNVLNKEGKHVVLI